MFNEEELKILKSCFEYVQYGKDEFYSISGSTDLNESDFKNAIESLKIKFL